MRTCAVHIGTHRTGTTSLQRTFSRHSAALRKQNYLYPRAGRPAEAPDGHHNLAWQISGDARFRPEYGSAADLLAEIRDWPHDVILSSEDFECSAFHADGFQAFLGALRADRFAVRVIVYLRNQVDYAQSLYQVLVAFGCPDTFEEFLGKILSADGRFCWRDWIHPFCYQSLLTHLEALDDVTVDVRSYDNAAQGSVVDFLSRLGLDPAALDIDSSVRINRRPDLAANLRQFCESGKGPLDRADERVIACLSEAIGSGPLWISDASRVRIVDRFRESNAYVRRRYGVELDRVSGLAASARERDETPSMDAVFSAYFRRSVDRLAALLREDPS